MRVSTAFRTFAFLLLSVVLFADRGVKINTNIVHNIICSSGQDTSYLPYCKISKCYCTKQGGNTHQRPADITSGICKTKGHHTDVLPCTDHHKIIPAQIYYGLDFTNDNYSEITYIPHHRPKVGGNKFSNKGPCDWGDGRSLGQCIQNGKFDAPDEHCPSTQREIVHAWHECA